MPNFTAGTSFTDGVTNDVTAAKLNALVADAVPTSSLALASTSGTISNFTSSTATFLGAITGSTNVINIGSGQIYKDASGNVGIGFTTPGSYGGYTTLSINNTTGGLIDLCSSGTVQGQIFSSGTEMRLTKTGANPITAFTNGAERLRIDSSGNVGIGTTSPACRLHLTGPDVQLRFTNGSSHKRHLAVVDADNSFRITRSDVADDIVIDSSGRVGIGTASPSAQLELSTDSAKKPSTNTWTITSDQRLKTNITNADNNRCYEIVKQVPLKRYTWKGEVYSQEQVKDRSKLGWIAQDVEEVFPKAVGTSRFAYNQIFEDVITPELDSDGNAVLDENGVAKTKTEKRLVSEDVIEDCKDLNSDQIYAAMYGTIQKLIEKVESLESKVAALEAA
jgi:hypothetical protein